jgi:hypothetical protein
MPLKALLYTVAVALFLAGGNRQPGPAANDPPTYDLTGGVGDVITVGVVIEQRDASTAVAEREREAGAGRSRLPRPTPRADRPNVAVRPPHRR